MEACVSRATGRTWEEKLEEAEDATDTETSPSWALMILASMPWDPEVNYNIS